MANLKKASKLEYIEEELWKLVENIAYVRDFEKQADREVLDNYANWVTKIATMVQELNDESYSASTKKSKDDWKFKLIGVNGHEWFGNLDEIINLLRESLEMMYLPWSANPATLTIELLDDEYSASTKKSKLSKEYRVNTDRDIDIDIMAGELTVRVSDVQSGWARNKQIDVMNLPWQIVGNITEILGENWDEIPQFVAIENALVEKYDEHWQEVNRQLHEQNGWKSTKKSKQKPINKEMSFEDNVNKMRKSNYDRTGNLNTIIKERR